MNREYFSHVGQCKGRVAQPAPITSNSNSTSYYNNSYSQPLSYTSSSSSLNSNPITYYSSSSNSTSVPTSSYTTSSYAANNGSYSSSSGAYSYSSSGQQDGNVIRTYTRTYVPSSQQNVDSGSGSTATSYTANTITTGGDSSSTSAPVQGRVISRRVIGTRVIYP